MEVKLYKYEDYKVFVNDWVKNHPSNGRGKYLELSKVLNVHTTLISQIFKGDKSITLEQAFILCDYLGFDQTETDYFMLLVQIERAGNFKLESYYQEKLLKLQNELQDMKSRITEKKILDENDKALFYSNWFYSAIRLSASLEHVNTKEDISGFTGLQPKIVNQVVNFLLSVGLLNNIDGKLEMGPAITHLESKSPLIARHHANWRVKAMDKHPHLTLDEFCFSAPLTINKSDAPKVREILTQAIESISEIVKDSDEVDQLYCVNIDWFNPIQKGH